MYNSPIVESQQRGKSSELGPVSLDMLQPITPHCGICGLVRQRGIKLVNWLYRRGAAIKEHSNESAVNGQIKTQSAGCLSWWFPGHK